MAELMYAMLLDRGDGDRVMAELRQDLEQGLVAAATVHAGSPDRVTVERGGAWCEVETRSDVGDEMDAILVYGHTDDPEYVGLGWDVLVLLSLLRSGDVWLSRYTEADLEFLGPVRSRLLNNKEGRVVSAEQFELMLRPGVR